MACFFCRQGKIDGRNNQQTISNPYQFNYVHINWPIPTKQKNQVPNCFVGNLHDKTMIFLLNHGVDGISSKSFTLIRSFLVNITIYRRFYASHVFFCFFPPISSIKEILRSKCHRNFFQQTRDPLSEAQGRRSKKPATCGIVSRWIFFPGSPKNWHQNAPPKGGMAFQKEKIVFQSYSNFQVPNGS